MILTFYCVGGGEEEVKSGYTVELKVHNYFLDLLKNYAWEKYIKIQLENYPTSISKYCNTSVFVHEYKLHWQSIKQQTLFWNAKLERHLNLSIYLFIYLSIYLSI